MNTGTTPLPTQDAEKTHSFRRFATILCGLVVLIGAISGSLSAFFLWSLDWATAFRLAHPQCVFALPLGGFLTVWFYRRFGAEAVKGNNLILERIRLGNGGVPARTVPLIFGSSILSHLFGASTGREGAAVQMGGAVASLIHNLCRRSRNQYARPVLIAGIAAGFASIFGTPLAGAMFAIEVPVPSRPDVRNFPVALLAAFTGHFTALWWGASHSVPTIQLPTFGELTDPKWALSILTAALLFGWAGALFIRAHQGVQRLYQRTGAPWWIPPVLGGLILCAAILIPGADSYIGLGTWSTNPSAVTISTAFTTGGATQWSSAAKMVLTAISLGSGFKGGEVTPLFFIGATLGNVFASHFNLTVPLLAALGFVAVFSGAAHTPLTGICIAGELFGWPAAPLFAPVCWIAHFACGKWSLYTGQWPDMK